MPIYDELWARADKTTSPGGSALNSARAQKFSNPNGSVAYFGCIGNDEKGQVLSDAVNAAGIEGKFEVTQADSTGVCACVVVGKERTLCANIGAAKKFSMDYFNSNIVSQNKRDADVIILTINNIFVLGNAEQGQVPLHHGILRRL